MSWQYCNCAGTHALDCPNNVPGGLPPLSADVDESPAVTVIETGWATIRTTGNATVFTAQVMNFNVFPGPVSLPPVPEITSDGDTVADGDD